MKPSLLACHAARKPYFLKQIPPTTKLNVVTGQTTNISTILGCKDLYYSFVLHTTYLYQHLMHS
jgi:hypothetical protein